MRKSGELIGYMIDCPGCGMSHVFDSRWTFNGNFEAPTFSPSLRASWPEGQCHFFVTDGKIIFCDDSTHDKKGTTVDLPKI